jgi:O-antigen ligase
LPAHPLLQDETPTMSLATTTPVPGPPRGHLSAHDWRAAAFVAALVGVALVLAMRGEYLPLVAPLALGAGAWALLRQPEWAVPLFAFLLYTNASAVAVQIHGLPFIVAASVPLLLCLPIASALLLRREAPVVTPALPFILAFLAVQLVGALFAIRPEEAMAALVTSFLEGFVLYVLVTNAIRTPAVLQQVLWALIAAGAFMGAVVGLQHLLGRYDDDFLGFAQVDVSGIGFVVDAASELRQPRVGGPLGMPNRFSQIMAVLIPIALFQVQASRSRKAKLLAGASVALILIGFALGFSRGAAVGLAATFLVMLAMGYIKGRQLAVMALAVAGVVLAVPQFAVRLASLANVAGLATQAGGPGLGEADSSTQGRITEMVAGVLIFADHPVIGVGPEMYRRHYPDYARVAGGRVRPNSREAHSLPVHMGAEHGAVGLALFAAIFWVTIRDLLRARRHLATSRPNQLLATGVLLAVVAFLATSVFLHASFIRYQWFLLALAAATSRVLLAEQPAPRMQLARLVRMGVGAPRSDRPAPEPEHA